MCSATSLPSVKVLSRFVVHAAAFCILGLAGPAWSQDRHDDGIYTWERLRELCLCDECKAAKQAAAKEA